MNMDRCVGLVAGNLDQRNTEAAQIGVEGGDHIIDRGLFRRGLIARQRIHGNFNLAIKAHGEGKPYDCVIGVSGGVDSTYVALLAKRHGLRCVAVALAAFVPRTSSAILEALGSPGGTEWANVAPGRTPELEGIEPATPLFPRIDEPAPA